MPKRLPTKPEESRSELVTSIHLEARRLKMDDGELLMFVMQYFTHIDLRLIRDELIQRSPRVA